MLLHHAQQGVGGGSLEEPLHSPQNRLKLLPLSPQAPVRVEEASRGNLKSPVPINRYVSLW